MPAVCLPAASIQTLYDRCCAWTQTDVVEEGQIISHWMNGRWHPNQLEEEDVEEERESKACSFPYFSLKRFVRGYQRDEVFVSKESLKSVPTSWVVLHPFLRIGNVEKVEVECRCY